MALLMYPWGLTQCTEEVGKLSLPDSLLCLTGPVCACKNTGPAEIKQSFLMPQLQKYKPKAVEWEDSISLSACWALAVSFACEPVSSNPKLKFESSFGSVELMCVGERVDMTRVWCLVAEGDYVRIRVSLCLLRSETEMEDGASCWCVRVYMCVCMWVVGI